MAKGTMIMHCGAQEVALPKVREVDALIRAGWRNDERTAQIESSRSYRLIPPGDVRDEVVRAIERRGLVVKSERWALSKAKSTKIRGHVIDPHVDPTTFTGFGARCFGLLEVGTAGGGVSFCVAVRHSTDKTIALSIVAGLSVMICDNMLLMGDCTTVRKHTSGLIVGDEVDKGLDLVLRQQPIAETWIDRLRNTPVRDAELNSIVCNSIRADVMPNTSALQILNAWHDGTYDGKLDGFADRLADGVYDDRTAWTAHGLWTEVVGKSTNWTTGDVIVRRHQAFNQIVNGVCNIA